MWPDVASGGSIGQLTSHSSLDVILFPSGIATWILLIAGRLLMIWEFTAKKFKEAMGGCVWYWFCDITGENLHVIVMLSIIMLMEICGESKRTHTI